MVEKVAVEERLVRFARNAMKFGLVVQQSINLMEG